MVMGIVLIFLIQWLFLGNLRSALIVSATIPFALLFAVVVLVLRGESANLLSWAPSTSALIVDATVIMVENIFRHLSEVGEVGAARPTIVRTPRGPVAASWRRSATPRPRSAGDLLLGRHHHRRLRAAVHPVRRRGPHLRADGARPMPMRSSAACSRPSPSRRRLRALLLPEKVSEAETLGGARAARASTSRSRDFVLARRRLTLAARRSAPARWPSWPARVARPGVPAQARGRQHLDPRHHAGLDLARGGQRLRQPHAAS